MKTLSTLSILFIGITLQAQMVFPDDVQITGPEEIIYDWTTDRCELEDIPDNEARFFRDADGNIQMVASHYNAFRMIGPDFDNLVRDCDNGYILESDIDPDIGNHDNHEWIHSLFTYDGATIYAYLHNEYHGHNYGCNGSYLECWYNSITFATSTDSGKTYTHAPAPDHFALAAPDAFQNGEGPGGYFKPSNIVFNHRDGYYYMLFQIEEIGGHERGTGIVRTMTPEDPASWRGWNGESFEVTFVDIYNDAVSQPALHRVEPLNIFTQGSLSWNTYFEKWMVVGPGVLNDTWGFYYRISDDLLNWSAPVLILESNVWTNIDADTNVDRTLYGSLIDHGDTSRTFMYTGRDCFLYYTRWHPGGLYDRDLVRVPVQFNKLEVDGWTVNSTAFAYDANPGDGKCESTEGGCTILAALEEANGRPQTHHDSLLVIGFDLPDNSVIDLQGPAGGVTHPTVFDGTTQTGYSANTAEWFETNNAQYSVVVDFNGHEGFEFNASQSGIRGMEIHNAGVSFRADSCFVEGCFIQTDGSDAHLSTDYAVRIYGRTGTRIGGDSPEKQNLLCNGIYVEDGTFTLIQNNKLDTDRSGSNMLVNNGASAITIDAGTLNFIIENVATGGYNRAISLEETGFNTIDNCIIGPSQDFTNTIGSYNSGVFFGTNCSYNTIQDTYFGASACGVAHILFEGGSYNFVKGCFINTDMDGNPIPTEDESGLAGIYIGDGSSNNSIGGSLPGEENTITGIPLAGIIVSSGAGDGNSLMRNRIWNNGGLGIDLQFDQWPNENDQGDADEGANGMLNHPVITNVVEENGQITITGSVSAASLKNYLVDLYASEACDPSEFGEGRYLLHTVIASTDADGEGSFEFTYTPEASHTVFSASMTETVTGNSSEFGPCVAIASPDPNIEWSPNSIERTIAALNSDYEIVHISNTGLMPLEFAVFTDQDWISPSITSGTLQPGENVEVFITMDASTLDQGMHGGNVYIESNDPDTPSVEIPVLVEVTITGILTVSEEEITLTDPNANLTYGITLTNEGTEQVTWGHELEPGQSWVTQVTPSGGTIAPFGSTTDVNIHLNTSGLAEGTHTSYVNINSNASNASTITVNIIVIITGEGGGNGGGGNGGGNTPSISVDQQEIQFFMPVGGNGVQPIQIQNIGGQTLSWNLNSPPGVNWLSVGNPNSGGIPAGGQANTFVQANANGLSPGVYTSEVVINSNASNLPFLLIPVTLNVTDGNGGGGGDPQGPVPEVTPEIFELVIGLNEIQNHPLDIFNAGDAPLTWNANAPIMDDWISIGNPNEGNVQPGMINTTQVQINSNGLTPGNYESEVVLNTNANPSNVIVPVFLTVEDQGGGGNNDGLVAEVMTTETTFCPESDMEVLWMVSNGSFNNENSFDLELSSPDGTFDSPTLLTTFDGFEGSGQLTVTLPAGLSNGDNYRLRLVANSPGQVGPASGDPLTIFPTLLVNPGNFPTLCNSGSPFALVGGLPSGGSYSGEFVSNNHFNPSAAGDGTFEIIYTVVSTEGCSFSELTEIEVSQNPTVALTEIGPFCSNSVAVGLSALPEGGQWTGPGVEAGTFFPELADAGEHTLTYNYSSADGCSASGEMTIEVFEVPQVAISIAEPVCSGNGLTPLPEATPLGGNYWGEFISSNSFDSDEAAPGTYTINYSYTNEGGCVNSAATELIVNPSPDPLFDLPSNFCSNQEAHFLDPNPQGGFFEGTGVEGTNFDPATAGIGVHELTYLVANQFGCTGMITQVTQVSESPEVSLTIPAEFCQNDVDIPLDFGTPAGGQYTYNGNIVTVFNPSNFTPGFHELSYYYVAENNCESVESGGFVIEEVPEAPVVNFDGTSLQVFNTGGFDLVWYLNGNPIDVTNEAFIPVESGEYSASYGNGECISDLSNIVDVTITGVEEMNMAGLSVYPVPFNDKLIIEASNVWNKEPKIRLYDINARLVRQWRPEDIVLLNGKYIINTGLALLPKGNYYLILDLPGQSLRSVITK